ncbi:MAG: extracellular solute-binding protein [Candidatus Saccharibacteria bacterium]|nr:extracellular solute-binding protein [Rhodoferax sp.]
MIIKPPAPSGLTRRSLLAAAIPLSLAAPVRATQRMVLNIAAFPLVDEIARAAVPLWCKLHPDVDIKIETRQYQDHHTAMTTALSTSGNLPDVMVLEASFLGRFAQGGGLEDLNHEPFSIGRFKERMVPFAYQQATNRKGAVVGMPTDIGPGTLLYRKDILERAGVSEDDLTRSWDSYVAAGVRIKAKTGAYLIGTVQSVKDILIRTGIQPGEGQYFDKDSNVLVTSDRFVRAFEVAREARSHKLDARNTAWSNVWAEGFKRGTVATEVTGAWMVGQLSNWVAPKTTGLWRAAALPEGSTVSYGGSFYSIPRRSDPARKALAWDFIQFMTLNRDRQLEAFTKYDAFPALLDAHNASFFEEPVEFLGGQKARILWRDTARKITAVQVHKQSSFADEVINTELDKVMLNGKKIPVALADAQRLLEQRAHR